MTYELQPCISKQEDFSVGEAKGTCCGDPGCSGDLLGIAEADAEGLGGVRVTSTQIRMTASAVRVSSAGCDGGSSMAPLPGSSASAQDSMLSASIHTMLGERW